MNIENIEIVGFIGAGLMVATLAMRTMIPLRVAGIVSSIFQIVFALLAGITPMLMQHSILLLERLPTLRTDAACAEGAESMQRRFVHGLADAIYDQASG